MVVLLLLCCGCVSFLAVCTGNRNKKYHFQTFVQRQEKSNNGSSIYDGPQSHHHQQTASYLRARNPSMEHENIHSYSEAQVNSKLRDSNGVN